MVVRNRNRAAVHESLGNDRLVQRRGGVIGCRSCVRTKSTVSLGEFVTPSLIIKKAQWKIVVGARADSMRNGRDSDGIEVGARGSMATICCYFRTLDFVRLLISSFLGKSTM